MNLITSEIVFFFFIPFLFLFKKGLKLQIKFVGVLCIQYIIVFLLFVISSCVNTDLTYVLFLLSLFVTWFTFLFAIISLIIYLYRKLVK